MAKVRKRTWQTKSGLKSGYIADYFAPDKDGRRKRHIRTFKTSQTYLKFPDQTAWLSLSVGYPRTVATRPVSSSE